MLLLALCCFSFASNADIKVEKVLETSNVSEYNQWVGKNKTICLGLRPVLVDYTLSFAEFSVKRFETHYYSAKGDEISTEIVEDSLLDIFVPMTNDRVFFSRGSGKGITYETVVKNARGDILFTVPYAVGYIGMDIYVRQRVYGPPPGVDANVLNSRGETIGKLKNLSLDYSRICIAKDERYAVLVSSVEHIGEFLVLVNKEGKEMWRHMFSGWLGYPFISKDGSKIGIRHGASVLVYNEDGSLFREYCPFGQKGPQANVLSDDGHLLVTARGSEILCFNNKDGTLLWNNDTAFIEDKGRVKFLGMIGDGDIIVAICRSHNLYVFDSAGEMVSKTSLELGTEWVTLPSDPTKKIEKLVVHWNVEFAGDYVIITKGKAGTRFEPLTRIVYQIAHN